MNIKQLKIRLHPTNHKHLKVLAAKQEKTLNDVVNQAVREFIIKHEGIQNEKNK